MSKECENEMKTKRSRGRRTKTKKIIDEECDFEQLEDNEEDETVSTSRRKICESAFTLLNNARGNIRDYDRNSERGTLWHAIQATLTLYYCI